MLWLLAVALVFGLGTRVVQEIRHRELRYPFAVVRDDAEVRALRSRADSILALRQAAAAAPININTAGAAEFQRLDGIGEVLSARIVAYREAHGPFRTVDELDNVSGIGPKRLAAIRERCVVDSL
ncbi:helix-hairpin-helix domain-containing protein [bacterium]|nr:helix-hairpin-helix domain-containing protein [bacterium]MBU1984166.1 helix-hairpin-helix domain-containing protein [bacterium]